ncbi:spore germination protein [Filobacillus milosensis]|uniref:Spore germination protein n=1 Tax=Filobacillus milosensis TaxID=94137 RepID=A0A4Y8IHW6_9BACI|nr:spore germination protein [Filobacillus milosensis]TFB15067.1 spore germination protein [Filobacillus milosensis]
MNLFNWMSKFKKSTNHTENPEVDATLKDLLKQMKQSQDFETLESPKPEKNLKIFYYHSLVDVEILHRDILPYLKQNEINSLIDIKKVIPIENITITNDLSKIEDQLFTGSIMIRFEENDEVVLIRAELKKARDVALPEVEFSVVGPKESFVESLDTNINLVRKRLPIPELTIQQFIVGKLSKTKVAILSIEGIANEENVNTVVQRIKEISIDNLTDSSYVTQLIADNPNSPFPQLIDTERPDRISAVLTEGKVAILVDGAPHALIGPITLLEFFSAFEDYFLNWIVASFFRIIRLFAVLFSILITPIYVAVLTYHYEIIPKDVVSTLVTSRREVPLPPILEAIFLELAIELLREAGARLPTKVGQTIGIVGGIVIGTASVQAGLTSNVLLIIVALAALASFTTPVYQMGNTIRLIRFPFLFFAHILGLLGITICFCYILAHLLKLTSLGRPILEPIYPPRITDLKDGFIRLPFSSQSKRPVYLQSEDTMKFKEKIKKRKPSTELDG